MLSVKFILQQLCKYSIIESDYITRLDSKYEHSCPISWLVRQKIFNLKTNKLLTQIDISQVIATYAQLEFSCIDLSKINYRELGELINLQFAKQNKIAAISMDNNVILIGCLDTFNLGWKDKISAAHNKVIKLVIITPDNLQDILKKYLEHKQNCIVNSNTIQPHDKSHHLLTDLIAKINTNNSTDTHAYHTSNNTYVNQVVEYILQYSFNNNISDIHLQVQQNNYIIKLRIDGLLTSFNTLTKPVAHLIINNIKVRAHLDITQTRLPQDGRFNMLDNKQLKRELRVSTLANAYGEKIVIRVLGASCKLNSLGSLGFTDQQQVSWSREMLKKSGLLLVTGATGSGKSATLYTSLKQLDSNKYNICTIEDPIENIDINFNQTQVEPNIGLDFATGLKAILRQDPDVIMIGEIRDLETAQIALRASLTGHLVLATMHTNDSVSAISRLLNMGIQPYLLSDTLNAVIAQCLIRKLCPHCKVPLQLSKYPAYILAKLNLDLEDYGNIYQAKGCRHCHASGYKGRIGVFELLTVTADTKKLIYNEADSNEIYERACNSGMLSFHVSALNHCKAGITSIEEVIQFY